MASGAQENPERSGSATRNAPGEMQQAEHLDEVETKAEAEDNMCPICLGKIGSAACVPLCSHRFCFRCIRRWARRKTTCPLCRQPFDHVLRMVTGSDEYWVEVLDLPTHRQRNTARDGVQRRFPQQEDDLPQDPTNSGPAAEGRAPEGMWGTAPGLPNIPAQQAAVPQASPAGRFFHLIRLVLRVRALSIAFTERRYQ